MFAKGSLSKGKGSEKKLSSNLIRWRKEDKNTFGGIRCGSQVWGGGHKEILGGVKNQKKRKGGKHLLRKVASRQKEWEGGKRGGGTHSKERSRGQEVGRHRFLLLKEILARGRRHWGFL